MTARSEQRRLPCFENEQRCTQTVRRYMQFSTEYDELVHGNNTLFRVWDISNGPVLNLCCRRLG